MKKLTFLFLLGSFYCQAQEGTIDSLFQLATTYESNGQYAQLSQVAQQLLQLTQQEPENESNHYGQAIYWSGVAQFYQANFSAADSLFQLAVDTLIQHPGKKSQAYIQAINYQAFLFMNLGVPKRGIEPCLEVVRYYEQRKTDQMQAYVEAVEFLGALYLFDSQHEKAEERLLESKRIYGELEGQNPLDVVVTLHYLSMLYTNIGEYPKAEPIFTEMQNIFTQHADESHPYYPSFIDNRAQFHLQIGNYAHAEKDFEESLRLITKSRGQQNQVYAISLNNLGLLYWEVGRYEKAEKKYLQALEIMSTTVGKENINYSSILHNLANVYDHLGNYTASEKLMLESLELLDKIVGKEHWKYAQTLNNIANVYQNIGRYEEAETYYRQAIDQQVLSLGEEHQNYALTLHNFGNHHLTKKEYDLAEEYLQKAGSIYKKTVGIRSRKYGRLLQSLGKVYRATERLPLAQATWLEAAKIQEEVLGQNLPLTQTMTLLAQLYHGQQQLDLAEQYIGNANRINQRLQRQRANHFSEVELQAYQNLFAPANDALFTLNQKSPTLSATSYNQALFQKGFLLENNIKRKQLVARAPQQVQQTYRAWQGYLRRLAKEYSKPIAERHSTAILEQRTQQLEKELVQGIAGFANTQRSINWQEIRDQLPPQSVAIEFIHYHNTETAEKTLPHYAALLLQAKSKAPLFIPLFNEAELQALLSVGEMPRHIHLDQLYQNKATNPSGLYQLIWAPLQKQLQNIERIYFAPSGLLHRINLGAIPVDDSLVIDDQFELIQLGSTRALLDQAPSISTASAVLFGGIDYEQAVLPPTTDTLQAKSPSSRGFTFLKPSISKKSSWQTLPWSTVEVEGIASLLEGAEFTAQLYTSREASEEAFKASGQLDQSPRLLHVATHGYFFPDPKNKKPQVGEQTWATAFSSSHQAMIRSGLILAGANPVWRGELPHQDREDGILTAYEISQLDLSNTELVVLSACETGLGDLSGHEGVYGLQRAFKMAGANYLIMSLWQVPDFQTQELMNTFYYEWLENSKSIPQAFKAAQAQMRKRFPEPSKWAGFILLE